MTHAEPFDVVVLCLAAGFVVLVLAAVVLDWIRTKRLRQKLVDAQHDLRELHAVMVEAGLVTQQADSDEAEGLH